MCCCKQQKTRVLPKSSARKHSDHSLPKASHPLWTGVVQTGEQQAKLQQPVFMINNSIVDEVEKVSENFEMESQLSFNLNKPNNTEMAGMNEKKIPKNVEIKNNGDLLKPGWTKKVVIETVPREMHRSDRSHEDCQSVEMQKTIGFKSTKKTTLTEF
jgi:hypothetical protein